MFRAAKDIFNKTRLFSGRKERSRYSSEQPESAFPTEAENPQFANVMKYVRSDKFINQIGHIKGLLRTHGFQHVGISMIPVYVPPHDNSNKMLLTYHEKEQKIHVNTGIFFELVVGEGAMARKQSTELIIHFQLGDKNVHLPERGYSSMKITFSPSVIKQSGDQWRTKTQDVDEYLEILTAQVTHCIPGRVYTTTLP